MIIRRRRKPKPQRQQPKRRLARILAARLLTSSLSFLLFSSNLYTPATAAFCTPTKVVDVANISTESPSSSSSTEQQISSESKQAAFEESQLATESEIYKQQQWVVTLEKDLQLLESAEAFVSAQGDKDAQIEKRNEITRTKKALDETNRKIKDLEDKRFNFRRYAVQELITNKERFTAKIKSEIEDLKSSKKQLVEDETLDPQVRVETLAKIEQRTAYANQRLQMIQQEIDEIKSQIQRDRLDRQISSSNRMTEEQAIVYDKIEGRLSQAHQYLLAITAGNLVQQELQKTPQVSPNRVTKLMNACKAENKELNLAQKNLAQSQRLKLNPEIRVWDSRVKVHTLAIEEIDEELKSFSNFIPQFIKLGGILLMVIVVISLYPAYLSKMAPSEQSDILVRTLDNTGLMKLLSPECRQNLVFKLASRIQEKGRFTTGDIPWFFFEFISFLIATWRS
jgi:hypothetical protein